MDLNRKIKLIEDSNINLEGKLDLILLILNNKPAITLDYIFFNEKDYEINNYNLFNSLNLKYFIEKPNVWINEELNQKVIEYGIHLSKNDYWLECVKSKNPLIHGKAYGYPDSAIYAFLGRIPKKNNPIIFNRLIKHFSFTFSKKYYKDEIKIPKKWVKTIKDNSRELYLQFKKYY